MNDLKILTATLADIYLQQGHIERAVEIYEKLARKDPRNSFYRQRLESIKGDLKSKQQVPAFKRILNKKLW
jgi:hypothetical protein